MLHNNCDKNISSAITKYLENNLLPSHISLSTVLREDPLSEWLPVRSGASEAGVYPLNRPLIFFVIIDWSMREPTSNKPGAIQWNLFSHLEDLDFPDDLALLSTNRFNPQD